MTYAVRFTSQKGPTAGEIRFERYETLAEAKTVASIMRDNGHKDATAVEITDAA